MEYYLLRLGGGAGVGVGMGWGGGGGGQQVFSKEVETSIQDISILR